MTLVNEIEAGQICDAACSTLQRGSENLASFPVMLKRIIKEGLWRRREVPMHGVVEMKSLRELVTTQPLLGWGEDPDKIEAIIRDDVEVLAAWREAMKETGHNQHTSNLDNGKAAKAGNTRAYTATRLKRDHPALFEDVKAGRLSANAAAIKAGFRKVKSPYEQVGYWWQKLDDEERGRFLREVMRARRQKR